MPGGDSDRIAPNNTQQQFRQYLSERGAPESQSARNRRAPDGHELLFSRNWFFNQGTSLDFGSRHWSWIGRQISRLRVRDEVAKLINAEFEGQHILVARGKFLPNETLGNRVMKDCATDAGFSFNKIDDAALEKIARRLRVLRQELQNSDSAFEPTGSSNNRTTYTIPRDKLRCLYSRANVDDQPAPVAFRDDWEEASEMSEEASNMVSSYINAYGQPAIEAVASPKILSVPDGLETGFGVTPVKGPLDQAVAFVPTPARNPESSHVHVIRQLKELAKDHKAARKNTERLVIKARKIAGDKKAMQHLKTHNGTAELLSGIIRRSLYIHDAMSRDIDRLTSIYRITSASDDARKYFSRYLKQQIEQGEEVIRGNEEAVRIDTEMKERAEAEGRPSEARALTLSIDLTKDILEIAREKIVYLHRAHTLLSGNYDEGRYSLLATSFDGSEAAAADPAPRSFDDIAAPGPSALVPRPGNPQLAAQHILNEMEQILDDHLSTENMWINHVKHCEAVLRQEDFIEYARSHPEVSAVLDNVARNKPDPLGKISQLMNETINACGNFAPENQADIREYKGRLKTILDQYILDISVVKRSIAQKSSEQKRCSEAGRESEARAVSLLIDIDREALSIAEKTQADMSRFHALLPESFDGY